MLKKIFKLKFLTGITLSLSLMGCAHYPLNIHYNGPKPLPEHIRQAFSYQKEDILYKEKIRKEMKNYSIKEIKFTPSKNILPTHHDIFIDYYDIHRDEKTPVIIVLPILGGSYTIAKSFAAYFTQNGYASVIINRQNEYKKLKNIEQIDTILRQMVFDIMQVIDWIETQEDLDNEGIGVLGVSMGGIKGLLITALDNRVKASVIALASGDISYLLTYSKERQIKEKKKKYMKDKNLTPEELYERLKDMIECDPMNYAEFINAEDILMIFAIFDQVVPYHKGRELREKIGKPETIYLFSGHFTAYPYIAYIKRQSLQFFRKKFEIDK
jgi:hypothetical protein